MKIYIAAPLYCDYEREYNRAIDEFLRKNGYDTYLPQRDGGVVSEMPDYIDGIPKDRYVFEKDIAAMNSSDVFLFTNCVPHFSHRSASDKLACR